jgi:hypothetical protein
MLSPVRLASSGRFFFLVVAFGAANAWVEVAADPDSE